MLGLCFHYDQRPLRREHWSWLVGWFDISATYEMNQPEGIAKDTRFLPASITTLDELPEDISVIAFQPMDGRNVQGNIHIDEFDHPKDAIYYFGQDNLNMEDSSRIDAVVYIPTKKYELYAAFAATIALDRRRVQWDQ